MDIVLALLAVPFALAVVLPLVIIIRLESRGSAFFRQSRVGRNETIFTLVKLRTMYQSTPDIPSHEAVGAMITPLGRILRKLKLDELPQIWNVLIGEMSFVGPRPCLATQQELIEARRALGVFSVRPGITGLAQVAGVDMSAPQKLAELDHHYIVTKSIVNDFKIMLATVFGRGYGDAIS
jgi:O-antigen biosynthesis protein WbqP